MPLQDHMQLISVDDHLIEHPRVWPTACPPKYQELGPRIVEVDRDKGGPPSQVWEYQGQTLPADRPQRGRGQAPRGVRHRPVALRRDAARAATTRCSGVADMDLDGVQAAAVLPVVPALRRHGVPGGRGQRRGAGRACRPATTSSSTSGAPPRPDRYIPLVHPAALGRRPSRRRDPPRPPPRAPGPSRSRRTRHRSACRRSTPTTGTRCSRRRGVDLPLCCTSARRGGPPKPSPDGPMAVSITLFGCNSMCALPTCCSRRSSTGIRPAQGRAVRGRHRLGALHARAARLHVGAAPLLPERQPGAPPVGAVPPAHLRVLHRRPARARATATTSASTSITVGVRLPALGLATGPTAASSPPRSLADVPDDEVHQIVELNARRLFNFDADLAPPPMAGTGAWMNAWAKRSPSPGALRHARARDPPSPRPSRRVGTGGRRAAPTARAAGRRTLRSARTVARRRPASPHASRTSRSRRSTCRACGGRRRPRPAGGGAPAGTGRRTRPARGVPRRARRSEPPVALGGWRRNGAPSPAGRTVGAPPGRRAAGSVRGPGPRRDHAIAERHRGHTVVVFTHGGVIGQVLCEATVSSPHVRPFRQRVGDAPGGHSPPLARPGFNDAGHLWRIPDPINR